RLETVREAVAALERSVAVLGPVPPNSQQATRQKIFYSSTSTTLPSKRTRYGKILSNDFDPSSSAVTIAGDPDSRSPTHNDNDDDNDEAATVHDEDRPSRPVRGSPRSPTSDAPHRGPSRGRGTSTLSISRFFDRNVVSLSKSQQPILERAAAEFIELT